MMLAPSTVIAIGAACQLRPAKLRGPRMMPLPPSTSITSLDTSRAIVVQWYLAIADGTAGVSPRSTAIAVAYIGRAHASTPATTAHPVVRLLLAQKKDRT